MTTLESSLDGAIVVGIVKLGTPGSIASLPPIETNPPNSVEMTRGPLDSVTPGGVVVGGQGKKGTGEEYLKGQGHQREDIDKIYNEPDVVGAGVRGNKNNADEKGAPAPTEVRIKRKDWILIDKKTGK